MNLKQKGTMTEQEFMERMKRANNKVKDGIYASIIDMLPEDRELAAATNHQAENWRDRPM